MYFSNHNEDIVYINHYSGLLEVEGEGVLCAEDAEVWPEPDRNWADDDDEIHHEHDIITLRFHPNGTADIHYNCFTPGSSAGSYGGGEYANELPKGFYRGYTPERFAERFPERLREQLMANDMLRRFLEAANKRTDQNGRSRS